MNPAADRHTAFRLKRRRARIAVLVCLVVLFLGYAYLTFLEAFLRPLLVGSPSRLYLLYKSQSTQDDEAGFYLRERDAAGRWQGEKRFEGDFQAAVGTDEEVWVVYRRSISVYRGGRQVRAFAVGLPWDLLAATPATDGPGCLAFGFDKENALSAARLEPAAADTLRWTELPAKLKLDSAAPALAAAAHGKGALVVWARDPHRTPPAPRSGAGPAENDAALWTLEGCFFDGERFTPAPSLALEDTHAFTLFPLEGSAALITVPEEHKESGRLRFAYRKFAGTDWGAPAEFRAEDERWYTRRVLGVSAWSQGGNIHLVISRAVGLEISTAPIAQLAAGELPRLEPVSQPASFGRPEIMAWLVTLLFLAFLLVFLGVSLLTERFRPSAPRSPVPAGVPPVVLASWPQRGLAFAIDCCVLFPALVLILWGLGYDPQSVHRLESAQLALASICTNLMIVAYSALLEGRSGQTVGKRIVGIHVLSEEGTRIGWRQALLRNLVRPIDGVGPQCALGLLFILSTEQSQRLGDLVARTVVAKHGPRLYA